MSLVKVADGLKPQADYSFLPPDVVAWAGYVGRPSIGVWTHGQVAALERTGRLWLPIWTPGDGTSYTRAEAQMDAAAMLAGLHTLGITDQRWVFLDVERSRWEGTPAATEDAAEFWCSIMRASGFPRAGWYGPWDSSAPWRANWTGTEPSSLPAGVFGWQYDHALHNDAYDISVFDPSVLDRGDPVTQPADIAKAVWDQPITFATGGLTIAARDRLAEIDHHVGVDLPAQLAQVIGQQAVMQRALTDLAAAVAKIGTGTGPATYKGTVELTAGA